VESIDDNLYICVQIILFLSTIDYETTRGMIDRRRVGGPTTIEGETLTVGSTLQMIKNL
jgi:hypothetical protein